MAEFEQVFDEEEDLLPPTPDENQWNDWVEDFIETPAFNTLSKYEQENINEIGWILFREMEDKGHTVAPFNWTEEDVLEVTKTGLRAILWDTEEEFNGFRSTTLALMRFLAEEKHLLDSPDFSEKITELLTSDDNSYEGIMDFRDYTKVLFKEAEKMGIDLEKNPERAEEVIKESDRKLEILSRYAKFFEKHNHDEDKALAELNNDEERKIVMDQIMDTMRIPEDEFSEKKMQQVFAKMQRLLKKYRGDQDQAFAELSLEEQRYMITYMTQQEDVEEHAAPQMPVVRSEPKIGRNDPCPCGSGKKYKKCHGA
jgi:hypothetical protein